MDSQQNVFTHYAILIGIDAYKDKPLKGCVRDVQDIKNYLEGVSTPVHIEMLTAPESVDPKLSSPNGNSIDWPTYDSVTSAFVKIYSLAKAGDFVYIHYSGHGTRATPDSPFSSQSTGDLALVLLSGEKENSVRYLWGPRLALSLNAMVNKGLVLTLVLDCCFSATVYRRGDPSVRFLPYNAEIDLKFSLNGQDVEKHLDYGAGGPTNRDASMLPNWLINPNGYAIITACGPHERAREFESEHGLRRGALSHLLLLSLECGYAGKRMKDIYNHLRAGFQKSSHQQSPVLYGNKDQGFFGHLNAEITRATVPIIEKQDGSLELQAGHAHGVCDGDQFAAYFMGASEPESRSTEDSITVTVIRTRGLTSDVEPLDVAATRVRILGTAKALTRFSLRKFPIRLTENLPYRDEWPTALKQRSLDIRDGDEFTVSFRITLNGSKEYEILDKDDQKIINLPILTQDQCDISSVCDVVEHLAKFELAKDLASIIVADPFRESFSAEIAGSGKTYHPGCLIEVEHDEKANFTLQVRNRGNKSLYVYVYDMGPYWQIQDILHASHEVVPAQNSGERLTGVFRKKMKMSVPSEMKRDHGQCEDIIKIFITSQPTTFDLLELPKLGHPAERDGNSNSRTDRDGLIQSSEDWAALNFHIRTYIK